MRSVVWSEFDKNETSIDLSSNELTNFDWKDASSFLTIINLSCNLLTNFDWKNCRNENIKNIYPKEYYEEYLRHKKSNNFVPFLPDTSFKRELHYELESIWWKCPSGIKFLEDVNELKKDGFFC